MIIYILGGDFWEAIWRGVDRNIFYRGRAEGEWPNEKITEVESAPWDSNTQTNLGEIIY